MKTKGLAYHALMIMVVYVLSAGQGWAYTETSVNNFFGFGAGDSATGENDTFMGSWAGSTIDGSANTFIGARAGEWRQTGDNNTFIGSRAGGFCETTGGHNNTFVGAFAGYVNCGYENTIIGGQSFFANTIGNWNTFLGFNAGHDNTGYANVFLGNRAGESETGSYKLYIDDCYGGDCTNPLIYGEFDNRIVNINGELRIHGVRVFTQVSNNTVTSLGDGAGSGGYYQTFIGTGTGSSTIGQGNSFIGYNAGNQTNTGGYNSFFGASAGADNQTGSYNTFIGNGAGSTFNSGSYNTVIGWTAGGCGYNTSGSGNVFLGSRAGCSETGSNKLYIDNCHIGGGNCTQPLIYGEFDNRIVEINGTLLMTSDGRLKKNIEPLKSSLDKVMHLQGVSYEWKAEENINNGFIKKREIGLIAQDVETVIPEVVHMDSRGYKALAYDKVVPVLIEAVKEQQATITDQKAVIKELKERLEKALAMMERRLASLENAAKSIAMK